MARGIINLIDPSFNGKILIEDMSGCQREQNDRNGLPLITNNTFHPWEVRIEKGVYVDEDCSSSWNRVCGEEFEWGVDYPALKI